MKFIMVLGLGIVTIVGLFSCKSGAENDSVLKESSVLPAPTNEQTTPKWYTEAQKIRKMKAPYLCAYYADTKRINNKYLIPITIDCPDFVITVSSDEKESRRKCEIKADSYAELKNEILRGDHYNDRMNVGERNYVVKSLEEKIRDGFDVYGFSIAVNRAITDPYDQCRDRFSKPYSTSPLAGDLGRGGND
jgi:hypothetical protein